MDVKRAVEVVLSPNLDADFSAWFGHGGAWLAGNPSTCDQLANVRHFWVGLSDVCACGEMEWPRGSSEPRKRTEEKESK